MIEVKNAIAVAFGKDKEIDANKQKWFEANEATLDWRKAKEPTYARAQMQSLELLRTTNTTNIPVELDSTCSQKQIIAVLTGNLKTAMCCNVITDNTKIQDAYKSVADEMSKATGLKFNRKQIKKSDMIDGYGAGEKRVTEQLKEDLKEYYYDGVVKAFYDATNTVCPTASMVKSIFQSLWDSERTEWTWTLPDGFKVTYFTEEARLITVTPFGLAPIEVIAHMIMPTSRNTGLGVNVIHSVDAYIARQMVIRCPFEIITIHDGFRCLPVHAKEMRKIYNEILAEITDSTLLEDIIKEISGIDIKLDKEFTGEHVMNSKYSIS
jgi:DNA-directed RNA polymerase